MIYEGSFHEESKPLSFQTTAVLRRMGILLDNVLG